MIFELFTYYAPEWQDRFRLYVDALCGCERCRATWPVTTRDMLAERPMASVRPGEETPITVPCGRIVAVLVIIKRGQL